jgi:hypothetical protein
VTCRYLEVLTKQQIAKESTPKEKQWLDESNLQDTCKRISSFTFRYLLLANKENAKHMNMPSSKSKRRISALLNLCQVR